MSGLTPGALRAISQSITIYIDNELDQNVNVQLKANREESFSKAVNLGDAVEVPLSLQKAVSFSLESSGWLPYIMAEVYCSTAPASGSLTVYRLRSKDDEVKLVDSLEIRDTSRHNPSTNPDKVLIQEW